MSAIEQCRSAALGGHVLRCDACQQVQIAYNSCRNRHCPKCQARAARQWLEARQADLLPVEYYHLVFTLPAPIAAIAYANKAVIYDLLFAVAAETLRTIAADPKHLGAEVGVTLVLHTWGSALTHHPHVHGVVPGGGLSIDRQRWVRCRPGFFLPVRVLSRLFRRRFLEELEQAHRAGRLQFFGEDAALANITAFVQWLAPMRACEWVVYAKRPFAGPAAVLAYLSRYTHRVAISNSRLLAFDEHGVTFRYKDYRSKGKSRYKAMTLSADEFIRRFLLHDHRHSVRFPSPSCDSGWLRRAPLRHRATPARPLQIGVRPRSPAVSTESERAPDGGIDAAAALPTIQIAIAAPLRNGSKVRRGFLLWGLCDACPRRQDQRARRRVRAGITQP